MWFTRECRPIFGGKVPDSFESVRPLIDATIDALAAKDFLADPICQPKYSTITSIVSSAYERHGKIIEAALVARLRDSPHLEVWREGRFRLSQAENILASNAADRLGVRGAIERVNEYFRGRLDAILSTER